jgi:hypothetical protein
LCGSATFVLQMLQAVVSGYREEVHLCSRSWLMRWNLKQINIEYMETVGRI